MLEGRDPVSGSPLGRELVDRVRPTGKVMPAVAGFDATFSAPKSLSVWWALTGDDRLLEAHDAAVAAALEHFERFGSTTRIRVNGRRLHPDTHGLTIAVFRQSTSRDDDPQIHTHAVISAKVQTDDGRWYALDARYLKRHQRMLGGLYQSLLRAELTAPVRGRLGADRERAGRDRRRHQELLRTFSKRSVEIDAALDRQGRRVHRSGGARPDPVGARRAGTGSGQGHPAQEVRQRCRRSGDTVATEAEAVGWTGGAADRDDRRRAESRRISRCRG